MLAQALQESRRLVMEKRKEKGVWMNRPHPER